jgi:outer membrane immunogenic protein
MPLKASPAHRAGCAYFGGFYLGGQAGIANYSNSFSDVDNFGVNKIDPFLHEEVSQSGRGALAGAQAGYNWQSGCTVFGIETDWAWTGAKASTVISDGGGFPPETTDHITPTSKLRWFGTTRIRTGVVVDNLLLYVTGGLAYANIKRDTLFFEDNGPVQETFSRSKTRLGWTAGAGAEWAINHNWSLKSEFLYMQFEKDETTHTSQIFSEGAQFRLKNEDSAWVGRIGLNYRFGY